MVDLGQFFWLHCLQFFCLRCSWILGANINTGLFRGLHFSHSRRLTFQNEVNNLLANHCQMLTVKAACDSVRSKYLPQLFDYLTVDHSAQHACLKSGSCIDGQGRTGNDDSQKDDSACFVCTEIVDFAKSVVNLPLVMLIKFRSWFSYFMVLEWIYEQTSAGMPYDGLFGRPLSKDRPGVFVGYLQFDKGRSAASEGVHPNEAVRQQHIGHRRIIGQENKARRRLPSLS